MGTVLFSMSVLSFIVRFLNLCLPLPERPTTVDGSCEPGIGCVAAFLGREFIARRVARRCVNIIREAIYQPRRKGALSPQLISRLLDGSIRRPSGQSRQWTPRLTNLVRGNYPSGEFIWCFIAQAILYNQPGLWPQSDCYLWCTSIAG